MCSEGYVDDPGSCPEATAKHLDGPLAASTSAGLGSAVGVFLRLAFLRRLRRHSASA